MAAVGVRMPLATLAAVAAVAAVRAAGGRWLTAMRAAADEPPPGDAIYSPPLPATLVREYPFVLDNFQRKSIGCLHRKESVLVAAHTSAGKTVVAE